MSTIDADPNLVKKLTTDDIIAIRRRQRSGRAAVVLVLFLLVIWSVNVTIIQDTDWERMGSIANVLESAGRFVGVDWELSPSLLKPTIETFMIACLGTLLGVLICVPVVWFGAMNITPFKPVTYPLARLLIPEHLQ